MVSLRAISNTVGVSASIKELARRVNLNPPISLKTFAATEQINRKYAALGAERSKLGLPVDQTFRPLPSPVVTARSPGRYEAKFRSGLITLSEPLTSDPKLESVSEAQIIFVGLECRIRQEATDEMYGAIGAIKTSTHESTTTNFPQSGDPFQMGPPNLRIVSTQIPVYQGVFANVALVCSLVEHDSGDIGRYKQEVASAITSAASIGGAALGIPSETFGATSGFLGDVSLGLTNVIFGVIGADDDPYTPQTLAINATDMELARTNNLPRKTLTRPDDPRTLTYSHSIILTGKDQGGDVGEYGLYFDLKIRSVPEFQ